MKLINNKQVRFALYAFLTLSSELLFGQVTDIDGNVYQTKLFGKKLWMIENLRVTRFNNGDWGMRMKPLIIGLFRRSSAIIGNSDKLYTLLL